MRKKSKQSAFSLLGYLIFFITIFVTVTVSIILFVIAHQSLNGDMNKVAVVMIVAIIGISAICTGVDVMRRKIMVERPANKILEATEKMAKGDFSVRLIPNHTYDRYDEYDLIMENINALASELAKSEILKTDFISNVSHELKTPLSIIRNYAELLQNEKDEEKRKKYAQTVILATKRLSDLVGNILKLNKLENQGLQLEYKKVALHDALAEIVVEYEDAIENKGLTLNCDFNEVEIETSLSSLEIVIHNLLSNAIKFTESGGKITVKLYREKAFTIIEVTDTGCGISAETGARIFDKFYQGDTSHSAEGNGLGLALVKKVIDLLGATVSVKSEVGKGSTFKVMLKDR